MYNFEAKPQYDVILEKALKDDISLYLKHKPADPGVYAGWDPAKLIDQSGFIILNKAVPTEQVPNPKLLTRMIQDISLRADGTKGLGLIPQANKIIQYDQKYGITKLAVDVTNESSVLEYLQNHFGSRVEGVKFSLPTKKDLIRTVQVIFQEKMIELNPHQTNYTKLRKELYELDPKSLKHPDKGSDDFAWALALAVQASKAGSFRRPIESGEADDYCFLF